MSTITSTSLGNGNGAYATDIVVKDLDLTVSNYVKDRTPITNMAMSKKRKVSFLPHLCGSRRGDFSKPDFACGVPLPKNAYLFPILVRRSCSGSSIQCHEARAMPQVRPAKTLTLSSARMPLSKAPFHRNGINLPATSGARL